MLINIQLSQDYSETLVIHEGETAEQAAIKFAIKVGLDDYVRSLLQEQITQNLNQITEPTLSLSQTFMPQAQVLSEINQKPK